MSAPPGIRIARITFAVVVVVSIGLAVMLQRGDLEVEDRWNPWAPLRIADPPNWLTRYKLARLDRDRAECRQVLAGADLRHAPIPDRETAAGCGFDNAVRISATSARVGAPFALSCRSAVALAMWERHGLQAEALARYGQPVARIEHLGSYACRNIYGHQDARRSRHATADALDIAGFILADGHRISVLAHWNVDTPDARFLHAVHARACRYFDAVLGPDYNAAHRDHLHFDRGSFGICR